MSDVADGTPPSSPDRLEIDPGHDIPASLARLLNQPDRVSWSALWRALPKTERQSAAWFALNDDRDSVQAGLVFHVAKQRHFREKTVAAWDYGKLADAATTLNDIPHELASSLIIGLHLADPDRRRMMGAYLDELDIPHSSGEVTADTIDESPEPSELLDASRHILSDFQTRDVLIYLLALNAGRMAYAPPLEAILIPDSASPERLEEESEPIPAAEDQQITVENFTTLDRLMILATIDVAQGIEGSLSEDQLDDLVWEVIELNKSRHRSFFHAGFLEALFDRPIREKLPAENDSRRGWYWAGRIQGLARDGRWSDIVECYDEEDIVQRFGQTPGGSAGAATKHVCRALLKAGRDADAVNFLAVPALVKDPWLVMHLTRHASALLDDTGPIEARPFFDLLGKATAELERQGVDIAAEPFLTIKRRQAHCYRRLGQFDRAREYLESLLADDPEINTKAMVLSDLGVMEAEYRSVTDVRLPIARDECASVLNALERGESYFTEAVELEARYSAHGLYCLAILDFLRRDYASAVDRLDLSLPEFRGNAERYRRKQFMPTLRLYRALAICLDGQEDRFRHAASEIAESTTDGAEIPHYLVEPVVSMLGAAAGEYGRSAAESVIRAAGRVAIDPLLEAGVQAPALAYALIERAGDVGQHQRAEDLRRALPILLQHRENDRAADVLDQLAELARGGVGRTEFLELLEDPDNFEPAWDPDEAVWEHVRCLESAGDYVTAANLLISEIHQTLSDEHYGYVEDAEAMLDHIRGYGSGSGLANLDEELAGLKSRIEALEPDLPESDSKEPDRLSVNIYFVGGDERQKKHQEWIREQLEKRDPKVSVEFLHPGWSGNWSPHLDEAKRTLPRMDAVVLSRFMRTVFGRQLRKEIGEEDLPWRGCHGAGRTAMLKSVLLTATAAREALESASS